MVETKGAAVIDIEVQNETHQTNERLQFAIVPRIGEGIRLREPDGFWASYDIIDLWYQQAEYGKVWVPYIHVRKTPGEKDAMPLAPLGTHRQEAAPCAIS
ncbi:hypothetical protein [Parapontixanthobacter aurantiacus]|uniref:hypothetical protein n=1 Tax=Parapontixanthobacter aurantiacus TaxID=1463599 RepID=UPI001F331C95|nr:hypothetical protein [Parapontixanthobacter aurantiacus]